MSTLKIQQYRAQLIDKKTIAADTIELRFQKPPAFTYEAGQFVQFLIPQNDRSIPRSYSLSSIPADDSIEFCVKLLSQGVASTHFSGMKTGEEIVLQGPLGRFVSPLEANQSFVFVATGAGLAPIMGLIRDQLENKKTVGSVHLLFGVRFVADVFWTERLYNLQKTFPNFSYQITVSRPENDWSGLRGRVTDHLSAASVLSRFYLCGNGEMVKEVRQRLLTEGLPMSNIRFEIF